MKRNLVTVIVIVFAWLSVFLLVSCAKKRLVTEEKVLTAPLQEGAGVEEGMPSAEEGVTEAARGEALTSSEEVRIETLEELEEAERREAEARALEATEAAFEAEPVYFDFDKSSIKQEYRPVLEKKAAFLKVNGKIRIRIEGNCDERGTNEYNLALGERRAHSAKLFLVSLGISPERIDTLSYGEERPLSIGQGEDVWAQNRRDDFVIIKR